MYGIVDIGSNTMRLSCYRVVDKHLLHVFHKKTMVGLAGYINEDNCLSKKGIKMAIDTLNDYNNIVKCVGLDQLYVIATASFRNVDNTDEIVKAIKEQTGIKVAVLSGKEEAMYDFKGATYCTDAKSGIVVDIGGGSTELVWFDQKEVRDAVSIPVGSLNTFTRFVDQFFPDQEEENEIRMHVRNTLEKFIDESDALAKHNDLILGVGGTNRACAKLYNDFYDLDTKNTRMECEKISLMLKRIMKGKKSDRKRILKMVPDRIHTIIPGIIVLDEIYKYYQCKEIELSAGGVREGFMLEKLF